MSDLLKIQEVNFETALIEHLQALGYETLLGSDIDRQSDDFRDVFIFDRLERAIRRINPGISAKAVALVIQKISEASGGFDLVERNQAFMQFLQQGVRVSFFDGKEQRNELYKLIDFDHPESNDFLAVNQWTIHEIETKRPDLVLFINGMPLVVFELKSPSGLTIESCSMACARRIDWLTSFITLLVLTTEIRPSKSLPDIISFLPLGKQLTVL